MAQQTKNNAKIKDNQLRLLAGIDPKTNLPTKIVGNVNELKAIAFRKGIEEELRIVDRQTAYRRYKWIDLPKGLNGKLIERILYIKGQACFFYLEANDKFYFLPYALNGNSDVYGQFLGVTPLIFKGAYVDKDDKDIPFINDKVLKPLYDVPEEEEIDEDMILNSCVILKDYSEGDNELIIPRRQIQNPLLEHMSEVFPMARTALASNSGVRGVRVGSEDEAENVRQASNQMIKASMSANLLIPITGALDFQDLTNKAPLNSEEYLLYLQALDSYRLSLYGLESGGLFQKKAHMLESEQEMNSVRSKTSYTDGLELRQQFCDIVNAVWGLNIWCIESDSVEQVTQEFDEEDEETPTEQDSTETITESEV